MNRYDFHKALKFEHPTLVCMRGVPGSGKSTKAHEIVARWGDKVVIHSTDDYFLVNGEYRFNPRQAGYYHARNREATLLSMRAGTHIIIVDNTNITADQFFPYYEAARKAEYRLLVIEAAGNNLDATILARRTAHGVPAETIAEMQRRFETEKVFLKRLEEKWERKLRA